MNKIITCLCLSIFICISILKPISIYAYTDLNTYIEPDLSVEDAKEYVAQTILAYALAAGAEIVVPGSGATVAEITDKVWDVIDFTDELYSWALKAKRNMQNGYLPWADVTYNLNPGSANNNAPILLAWDRLKENWDNNGGQIETYPEVNYLPYIELINGTSFNYQWNLTDNWFTSISSYNYNSYVIDGNPKDYSYIIYDTYISGGNNVNRFRTLNEWNNNGNRYIANYSSNIQRYTGRFLFYNHINIYINKVNNVWQCTTSTLTYNPLYKNSINNHPIYGTVLNYDSVNNAVTSFAPLNNPVNNVTWQANCNTLEDCFKLIAMNFRNVNVYVDGIPWTIITQPPDPIKLGGDTYITDTNTPVYYDFPDGTLFDPNAFAAIMRQLIDLNNTGNAITIQLDDVLESFTDEYGVTAQYVVNVVRNDYDDLISEQYGNYALTNIKGINYPNEQIQPYTSTMAYVTNESTNLIPNDILIVLAGTGVLILFAFLINRMLE